MTFKKLSFPHFIFNGNAIELLIINFYGHSQNTVDHL